MRVKPELRESFRQGLIGDAERAVRDEPNCFRFDVTQNMHDPNLFHLVCVFADEAAHPEDVWGQSDRVPAPLSRFLELTKRSTPDVPYTGGLDSWRTERVLECTNVFPADDKDWKRWKP